MPSQSGHWLVRIEKPETESPNPTKQVDFVLGGVTGFSLRVSDGVANVRTGQAISSTLEEALPIEGNIELSIFNELNSEPFYEYEYRAW